MSRKAKWFCRFDFNGFGVDSNVRCIVAAIGAYIAKIYRFNKGFLIYIIVQLVYRSCDLESSDVL